VAIAKPEGSVVHRTRGSVGVPLIQRLRDQLQRRVYPVHRIDRGTSGVLLFALDADTLRAVRADFDAGRVEKRYVALVRGWPAEAATIDHPLKALDDDAAPLKDAPLQAAVTHLRRLATVELPIPIDHYPAARYALVELTPEHGRRHQLRRHLKHVHHPIIGDTTYGKGPHNRLYRERYGCARMLLHAATLALAHPVTRERLVLVAPVTGVFQSVLDALGLARAEGVS
jgi:tRNA pseudouridine65 synthase